LEGSTPSEIKNVVARAWSAMMRRETSVSWFEPYSTLASVAA
jgi:hypothetical protein